MCGTIQDIVVTHLVAGLIKKLRSPVVEWRLVGSCAGIMSNMIIDCWLPESPIVRHKTRECCRVACTVTLLHALNSMHNYEEIMERNGEVMPCCPRSHWLALNLLMLLKLEFSEKHDM